MSDVNIKPIVDQPLEGQSAAIENLDVTQSTGVDALVADNQKPAVKRSQLTTDVATEGVARTMSQSRDIASAVAPEVPKLNDGERLGRTARLTMESSDVRKRRTELALQVMDFKAKNPDKPVPDDIDLELAYYREEYGRISKELQETKPTLLMEGASAMLSSFRDTIGSAVDNWGKVVAGTATGASIGAIGGSVALPGVGTFAGLLGGATTGASLSILGVSALDNIKWTTGETYDELSNATVGNQPVNMSEESKRYISYSIGVLGGAVEFGLEKYALGKIPGLRGFFNPSKVAKEIAGNPRFAETLIQFGKGIAANVVGEGTVEGVQYNLDILAEELGKTWDGSLTSLYAALLRFGDREGYAEGLGKSITVGGIAGGTGAVVLGSPGVASERVAIMINQTKANRAESARVREQVEIMGDETSDNGTPTALTPDQPQPKIAVENGTAKYLNAQQSLTLALVLQNTSDTVKDTKLDGQLSTAVELQKNMLEQSGVNQVWVSSDDLAKWADTEQKREKVRSWFGLYDPDLDSRLPIEVSKLSEMLQEFPEFSKIARPTFDGMSFDELIQYYKDKPDRINRDFMAMGVAPSQAPTEIQAEAEPVPITAGLGPSSTDEEIVVTLGTQQEANDYLARLAAEEKAILGTEEQISLGDVGFQQAPETQKKVSLTEEDLEDLSTQTDMFSEGQFKNQFKVIETDGIPVYHGTGRDFAVFEVDATGAESTGDSVVGVFFTDSLVTAESYAKNRAYSENSKPIIRQAKISGKIADFFNVEPENFPQSLKETLSEGSQSDKNILQKGLNYIDLDKAYNFVGWLDENGYTAVRLRDTHPGSPDSYFVPNSENIIYTDTITDLTPAQQQRLYDIRDMKRKVKDLLPQLPEAPPTAGLGPSSTDEEILATLGDRQAANEYLGRLQDEEFSTDTTKFTDYSRQYPNIKPSENVQGETLFHVTRKSFTVNKNKTFWTYNDRSALNQYGGKVVEIKLDSTANVVPVEEIPDAVNLDNMTPEFEKYLVDNNIDAVLRSDVDGRRQIVVTNMDKVFYKDQSTGSYYAHSDIKNQTPADAQQQERLTQIQQMRERVTGLIDQLPEAEPNLDSTQDLTLDEDIELAFQEFASRPIYTDLIRAGVTPSVVQMLEGEYARIRQDIIAATREAAYDEMVATAKITDEVKKTEDAIEAIEASINDPNVQIVDTYLQNLNREGKAFQVNINSLTEAQKAKYLDDPVLKKRGVFGKYGELTLNDLALQMGLTDPEYALSLLQKIPDLDKVFKDAEELTKQAIDTEILDSTDYNNTAIIKALEKKQKLDAQAFNLLVQSSWSKARKGVEGTVFAKVNLEQIKQETAAKLEKIPTGKLNPNVYARSSKRASVKKIKAALRGDFLEAARQREIEIRSDEAYKQALVLKAKTNRMTKKLGRWLRDRGVAQILKDAKLLEAFQDLSKLVNLDPDAPSRNGAFEAAVKKMTDEQIVDMAIPQDLVNNLDPAATPSELSFEQFSFVYNKVAELIKQARDYSTIASGQEKLYIEEVGQPIVDELTSHPEADSRRLDRGNPTVQSAGKKLGALLRSVALHINNINFITQRLSQLKENSAIRRFIYDQLKGIGYYDNGYGEKGAMKERARLKKLMAELSKSNSRDKRTQAYAKEIITPVDFAGSVGLLNDRGEMTKLQLMTLVLYYGTQTGRQRLSNFNVNPDTVLQVAEKYLIQDDIEFIQSIWDSYDTFKPAIKRMVEDIKGQDVEFVEGASFTFGGKQYRGGYVPLRYRRKATLEQAMKESERETNVTVGLEKETPFNIEQAEAFTKQGNLIERVKNFDGQLNLDWNYTVTAGFEDIIMQTTMHVPILNIMRLLNRNKKVADSIASVIGLDEFEELKNHIIGAGRSHISEQLELSSELADNFLFAMNKPVVNFVKNTLIGVPSTAILQLSSGVYAWHSQGIGSTPRYTWNVIKLLARPHLIPEAIRLASQLDPSIGAYVENIAEDGRGGIGDVLAKDVYTGSAVINRLDAKVVNFIKTLDEAQTAIFLNGILGTIDTALKVPAVLTMYENFKNGKVKGYSKKVLAKMSEAEIEREARAYASRTSQSTLTATSNIEKAKAQKMKWLRGWTRYFNDVRNIYNYTALNTFSKTKWALNAANKDRKNGNYLDASMKLGGIVYGLIAFQMYATVAATVISAARGRGTDEEGEDIELATAWTSEWEGQIIQTAINHFTDPFLLPKTVVAATPILRDAVFSVEVREATGDRVRPIVAPMDVNVINVMVDAYRAAQVIWSNDGEFGDRELTTVLKGLSTALPIPYRAIDQYMKSEAFTDKLNNISNDPGVLIQLPALPVLVIDALLEKFKNNPEVLSQVQILKDAVDPNKTTQVTEIVNGSEKPLTDYESEIIKFAESNGSPNAKAKTSGAYGLYQFTPDTWKLIVNKYGSSYGLTQSGLYTSVEQQEKAFQLLTRDNALALTKAGIPVNIESVYAAHHFGSGTATKILKLPDTAKLPNLDKARRSNPWLDGDVSWINDGKKVKTVADFKRGIKDLLKKGESDYIESLNLALD